ncbi:transmembrane protein 154 [Talpa occidentalis]|uniref:transmembrane protein 154 n=1 Tax=Talpa occidentalis TaxID=50954 RepID=UPI0018909BF1|nr:transmembrane protein 154 [Talpa occidentalis]
MKTPRAALVTQLLSTGGAQGYFEDSEQSGYMPQEEEDTRGETITQSGLAAETTDTFFASTNVTFIDGEEIQLQFILMVLIPVVLLALLLGTILLLIYYKRKRSKQEPSSQESQNAFQTYGLGSENLKVPIFEEDTPSVMEIEMEELDKWMNSMNKNDDCGCLPPLKEEKESIHSPSDNES